MDSNVVGSIVFSVHYAEHSHKVVLIPMSPSQVAVPRKTNPKLVMRTKKIFVGGLSATTSLEDVKVLRNFFKSLC